MSSTTSTPTPLERHTGQQAEYTAMLSARHEVKSSSIALHDFFFSPRSHSPLSIEHSHARNLWQALLASSRDWGLPKHLQSVQGEPTVVDSIGDQCIVTSSRLDGGNTTYKVSGTEKSLDEVQSFHQVIREKYPDPKSCARSISPRPCARARHVPWS
ncbi:hypothetical protein [Pseudomonas sp. EA_5y_Pfl2_R50]|uniref:hypothetical protein n=1 Tax=Pseudomonas sp. EA_5y_Pfl2_R50 TaxID=3088691 RepID=UPI0030DAB4BE